MEAQPSPQHTCIKQVTHRHSRTRTRTHAQAKEGRQARHWAAPLLPVQLRPLQQPAGPMGQPAAVSLPRCGHQQCTPDEQGRGQGRPRVQGQQVRRWRQDGGAGAAVTVVLALCLRAMHRPRTRTGWPWPLPNPCRDDACLRLMMATIASASRGGPQDPALVRVTTCSQAVQLEGFGTTRLDVDVTAAVAPPRAARGPRGRDHGGCTRCAAGGRALGCGAGAR